MSRNLKLIFVILFLIGAGLAFAIPLIPQGDIDLMKVFGIRNATSINGTTISMTGNITTLQWVKGLFVLNGTGGKLWKESSCVVDPNGYGDYTDWQGCHDSLPSSGGLIHISCGVFGATKQINITKSNITIEGEGDCSVLRQDFDGDATHDGDFIFHNPNTNVSNIVFRHFKIDGNHKNSSIALGFASTGYKVSYFTMDDITYVNSINNFYVTGGASPSISDHLVITNSRFIRDSTYINWDTDFIDMAGLDCKFINNYVETNQFSGGTQRENLWTSGFCNNCEVSGNIFKSTNISWAVDLEAWSQKTAYPYAQLNVKVANNIVINGKIRATSISPYDYQVQYNGLYITGNQIYNKGLAPDSDDGIDLHGTMSMRNVHIVDNEIHNPYDGIVVNVAAGANNLEISGNQIYNATRYSLYLLDNSPDEGNVSSNLIIKNNQIYNQNYAIPVGFDNITANNVVWEGNLIQGPNGVLYRDNILTNSSFKGVEWKGIVNFTIQNNALFEGNLTVNDMINGNSTWRHQNYPVSCPNDTWVTQIGDSNTCTGITFSTLSETHTHNASNITSGTFGSGPFFFPGNVSASWFLGIFNWVIGLGTNSLSFNGTALNLNESKLANTHTHTADNITSGTFPGNYTVTGILTAEIQNWTQPTSDYGLVLYAPLDNNTQDYSTIGTIPSGVSATATPAGRYGGGYSFNGATGAITYPYNQNFNHSVNNNFTISFWAKGFSGNDKGIVSRRNSTCGDSWSIFSYPASVRFEVFNTTGAQTLVLSSSANFNTNLWYHIVGVYESNVATLYINGKMDSQVTGTLTGMIKDTNCGVFVGYYYNAASSFTGTIDDVRLYNRALPAGEIKSLYSQSSEMYPGQTFVKKTGDTMSGSLTLPTLNATIKVQGMDYYSGDGSQGITNSTGYWLCADATCITKCQVSIKDGLITGCT